MGRRKGGHSRKGGRKGGRGRIHRRRHRRGGRRRAAAVAGAGVTPQNLFPYGVASSLLP
jgi:hypothetical protein